MKDKKKRGRPPKDGEPMTGAERTREWRERKREEERQKLSFAKRFELQLQEKKWLEREKEKRRKEIEKTVSRHPKVVKEYLAMAVEYRTILKLSIEAAERGLFSPESLSIIKIRKEEIDLLQDRFIQVLAGKEGAELYL